MKPIGHALTLQLLQKALEEQRIHNSYLFVGSDGIGKRTLARWFAERLLYVRGKRQLPLNGHPDFYTLAPLDTETALRGTVKIEAVQALIGYLRQQPLISTRSVILLDQADALTTSAANALLKTLEEPRKAVLLLTTDQPEKVPTTIRSRCQIYYLQTLSESECRAVLAPFVSQVPATLMALAPGQPGQILQHSRIVNSLEAVRAALQQGCHAPHECLGLSQSLKPLTQTQQVWLLQWWQRSLFDQPHLLERFDQSITQLQQHVQPQLVWDVLLLQLRDHGVLTLDLPAAVDLQSPIPVTAPLEVEPDVARPTAKSSQTRKSNGSTKTKSKPTIAATPEDSTEAVVEPVKTATGVKQHSLFAKRPTGNS